jgi:uncharacterized protein (TIGR02594 family)
MQGLVDQPAWMAHAWADLGVREDTGPGSNTRVLAYYADAGHREVHDDAIAWCAAFVGACLERGGSRCTRSLLARSYLSWGQNLNTPKLGAIAVFSRGADPELGHVGFVVGTCPAGILVLSGNQSDQVMVATFPSDSLLGLRWPPVASPEGTPAQDIFNRALDHILAMEGGYTDDPADPGGPTNLGLTLIDLAAWTHQTLNATSEPALKVALKSLTPSAVAPIYLARYWAPSLAAEMPPPIAVMHFDAAVNHGLNGAAHMLQQALAVSIDGEIGPETMAALGEADIPQLLNTYADIRRARYRSLPHFPRFGRGWLARVDKTVTAAKHEISSRPPTQPYKAPTMAEHPIIDISGPDAPKWWGHSLTIWGTLITAASTVLPVIGPLLGIDVTPDLIRSLGDGIVQTIQAVGGVIGTIMAIAGRARATAPLIRRPISLTL